MTIQSIKFKGQQVSLGDTVEVKLVNTHTWAGDFKGRKLKLVINDIGESGAIGGRSTTNTGIAAGWPAYVALSDDGDPTSECTLISVTKPTTKE